MSAGTAGERLAAREADPSDAGPSPISTRHRRHGRNAERVRGGVGGMVWGGMGEGWG